MRRWRGVLLLLVRLLCPAFPCTPAPPAAVVTPDSFQDNASLCPVPVSCGKIAELLPHMVDPQPASPAGLLCVRQVLLQRLQGLLLSCLQGDREQRFHSSY